jgi:hypothetical protein
VADQWITWDLPLHEAHVNHAVQKTLLIPESDENMVHFDDLYLFSEILFCN